MSYIKSFKPEIANIVGIQAALLLNHIKFWMDSKGLDKIYRTNANLSDDFEGTLSESQIQRAKKKLVDNGFIIITHDKGHTRTSHFTLTEKAKSFFTVVVEKVKKAVSKVVEQVKKPKKSEKKTEMEKSFDEGFQNKNAIPFKPTKEMIEKIRGKSIEEDENVVNPSFCVEDELNQNGDEDYFMAIDKAFEQCAVVEEQEKSLSLSELMSKAFSQVPNLSDFKNKLALQEQAKYFKEDY